MALVPSVLETQINLLMQNENLTPEQATERFAQIITDYIKTAEVIGQGTGANAGGPITTVVKGTLL